MNIEFHYYAIHYLCTHAGLSPPEAEIVASSSQLVDEILIPLDIRTDNRNYRIPATQNYRFWSAAIQRDVYTPFHFIPGDPEAARIARRDGIADSGIVTPDSANARSLLVPALRSGDLFRIGIALHAYADTWAHQHFSAIAGPANIVDTGSILPPAGHLQAMGAPDDPGMIWEDRRLVPELQTVVNSERFLAAARKVYRFLCTWRHREFKDEDFILDDLYQIWTDRNQGKMGNSAKSSRIGSYIIDLGVPPRERGIWMEEAGLPVAPGSNDPFNSGYNRLTWLKSTIPGVFSGTVIHHHGESGSDTEVHYIDPGKFYGSRLNLWNEAAEAHRSAVAAFFSAGGPR